MPAYKNQHFVPRALLRPFSVDGFGKAINLHLLAAGRPVFAAPLKSQCAKPYLYGQDGKLEQLLGDFEARYAHVLRELGDGHRAPTANGAWLLRYFMLLQSFRTAEQIRRGLARAKEMASFFRKAEEAHGNPWDPSQDPTPDRAMTELMLAFAEQMQAGVLDDLKVTIIRNRTARDFLSSDDPAVTTNRWLLQRKRINIFGSNAAGLILMLPLGPRVLAMAYDPAVYHVPASAGPGLVDVRRETDVLAFNEHQYIRAAEAIYFRREEDAAAVATEVEVARPLRPRTWDRFTVARRDGGTDTHDRYTVDNPDVVAEAHEIMFHVAREWPTPSRWPSVLRFRHDAHGFSKGRVLVRRAFVQRDGPTAGSYYRVG